MSTPANPDRATTTTTTTTAPAIAPAIAPPRRPSPQRGPRRRTGWAHSTWPITTRSSSSSAA